MTSMLFDDAFVRGLQRRWTGRHRSEQPDLLFVATSPDRAGQRAWMNEVFAMIAEPGASRLRARIQDESNFVTAYSELAVAGILQSAGLEPEFEIDVAGVTPDLFVRQLPLLVEVRTRKRPDDSKPAERSWAALSERIATIPVPVVLMVAAPSRLDLRPPDGRVAKRIARQVRDWLLRANRPAGSLIEVEGYVLRVWGQVPGLAAGFLGPTGGGWANSDVVLDAIRSKVSRYRDAARQVGGGLVVVLAAEAAAALDLDMLRAALAGTNAFSLTLDPLGPDGPMFEHTTQLHVEDVPATFDPVLSAVGWLNWDIDSPGTLTLLERPGAAAGPPAIVSPLVKWG